MVIGRTRRHGAAGLLCVLAWPVAAFAQPLMLCGQNGDGRDYCVRQSELREDANRLRTARLFLGYRVVHPQQAFVRVDCRAEITELLDYRLSPYWSATFDKSRLAWTLGGRICEAQLPGP
jgi:hypothetical protein